MSEYDTENDKIFYILMISEQQPHLCSEKKWLLDGAGRKQRSAFDSRFLTPGNLWHWKQPQGRGGGAINSL